MARGLVLASQRSPPRYSERSAHQRCRAWWRGCEDAGASCVQSLKELDDLLRLTRFDDLVVGIDDTVGSVLLGEGDQIAEPFVATELSLDGIQLEVAQITRLCFRLLCGR